MRIALGMPRVGDVPAEVVSSHMKCGIQIAEREDVDDVMVIDVLNVFPFDRARELVISRAFQVECDYLLFIDADIMLPLNTFNLLYDALIDKDAVATSGNYHRRGHPYTSVWSRLIETDDPDEEPLVLAVQATKGVHLIHTSGLGCCLIDLSWVKDNLEKPYFRMSYNDDGTTMWEDSYFFSMIHKEKGKVYGHADVRCGHLMERTVATEENWKNLIKTSIELKVDGYADTTNEDTDKDA